MGLRERAGKDSAGSVGRSRTILLSSHMLAEALADPVTNRSPGHNGTDRRAGPELRHLTRISVKADLGRRLRSTGCRACTT